MHRTPITWALYGVNGAWASFVYLSGPVAPVLVEDLGLSVGVAGAVATALAVGIATSSAIAPAAVRRWGRPRVTQAGLAVIAVGLCGVILAGRLLDGAVAFAAILGLVWVTSTGGGSALNASTARLADAHPEHSAAAITEANAVAAWVGVLSPLLLGAALAAGLGWSAGVAVCVLAAVAALVGLTLADRGSPPDHGPGRRTTPDGPAPGAGRERAMVVADEGYEPGPDAVPAGPADPGSRRSSPPVASPPHRAAAAARLPATFRVAMVALFCAVGTEFSLNYWGSTLIQQELDAGASTATSAMSAVVAGIAVGRTAGSGLTARLGPHRMLLGGFCLSLLGFVVLWVAPVLAAAVGGLFVVGLGLATLFPLLLDRAILLSSGQPDRAMARSSLILGLAAGSAPFVLGALGSVVSVRVALLLVPALALAGLVAVARSRPAPAGP